MARALISWRGGERTDAAAALERAEAERSGLDVAASLAGGTLVSGERDALETLESRGYRVKLLRDTNVLRMGAHDIDIERGEPEVPSDLDVPDPGDWPHHLVQLIAPPEPEWVRELETRSVKVVEQVGSYGLFVTGHPDAVDALAELPFVAWTGRFKPAYRVHPSLLELEGRVRFVSLSVVPSERADDVVAAAEAIGARVEQRWDASPTAATDYAIVIVEADAADVPALASIPYVRWLEFEPPKPVPDGERETQIVAENLDGAPPPNTAPVTGYQVWLAQMGLNGNGVSVAIVDTGVDRNASNNTDGHLDVRGRQADFVNYAPNASVTDTSGHGTNVAGIAIGNAASLATDGANFLLGQGMAPAATYVNQNLLEDTSNNPVGGYPTLTKDAVSRGAHVMNNSWGGLDDFAGSGYTTACKTFDELVRDPNEDLDGLQYLAIVFSAGNAGGAATTLTTPHEAKNPIVVGNSLTSRPGSFPSDDIRGIHGSSSRGPAVDGRIVPHVVAPGTEVSAAESGTLDDHTTWTGTSQAAPHVSGACALLIQWWRTRHGGSDPSPAMLKALLVNGAIDLAGGQSWRVTNKRTVDKNAWSVHSGNIHKRTLWFTPSGVASASAFLAQAASLDELNAGEWFFEAGTSTLYVWMPDGSNPATSNTRVHVLDAQPLAAVPNGDQGWGRVSLENVLLQAPVSDRGPKVFFDNPGTFTASGQQFQTDVVPWDSTLPMRVTLAWTDAPGASGANPALVNDLDLEVTEVATGTVYKGNVFSNGLSVAGGSFDSINNVECVFVPNPSGTYTVRVLASSVTANAQPPYDLSPWQDFALVIENVDVPSADPVNVVPVLDRSGSMVASGYVDVTKLSSKQFVDATRVNDALGVVSFGDTGEVEFPTGQNPVLQTVTGQEVRAAAKNEIESISFGGCTFMGDGLAKAGALLAAAPEPRAIVLLSDGYDNKGCDAGNADKPSAMDAVAMLPQDTRVYTCAMGPASDQALLEQIAVATMAEYYYMPTVEDLVEIYNYIQADVSGESLVANESASASRSSISAFVDAAATEASFNVAWGDPNLHLVTSDPQSSREISVTLRDPLGRALHPSSTELRTIAGDGYAVLKLSDPAPGLWNVEVATGEDAHVRYTVGAFVRSPIRLDVSPIRRGIVAGTPLTIGARVWDGRRPIPSVGTMDVVAPGAGIPSLLKQHADALGSVRPDKHMSADAVPDPIARLLTLREAILEDGRDLFATARSAVRMESVKGPFRPVSLVRPVLVRGDLGPALSKPGPFMRGQLASTQEPGSYNVVVTAAGVSPVSRTRFVRKALVSVRIA